MESKPVFLICHRGALGDFLLCWPALRALRLLLPGCSFLGISRPAHLRLAIRYRLLDQGLDMESARLLDFFTGRCLPPEITTPAGGVLWLQDGTATVRLLERSATLPVACLPPFPAVGRPMAAGHLTMLRRFFPKVRGRLRTGFANRPGGSGYALVHPGSSTPAKNFDLDLYRQAADLFREAGYQEILFLLGPAEARLEEADFGDYRLIRPPGLGDLADLLEKARLFLGNDSGVSHLAALLGIPTLALYKATDPSLWGTVGPHAFNLRAAQGKMVLARIRKQLIRLQRTASPT